jgi:hypothetical protein
MYGQITKIGSNGVGQFGRIEQDSNCTPLYFRESDLVDLPFDQTIVGQQVKFSKRVATAEEAVLGSGFAFMATGITAA